jgi:uncharacterized protein
MSLTLTLLPGQLAVGRMDADDPVPRWVFDLTFWSVTRTGAELSITAPREAFPPGIPLEGGWRAFEVQGPLDFSLTGILSGIAAPLAKAGISIFAISTYDTDYVLVKETQLEPAKAVLTAAGFILQEK